MSLLRPYQPSAEQPWDQDAALHLWRRAGFGAGPEQVAATVKMGPARAVEQLIAPPGDDPAEEGLESIYDNIYGSSDPDNLRAWLITRMTRCQHQLREKLALFWHSHFATSILKVRKVDWMARQYRLFLDLGLGKFDALLGEITRDPAMIRWLDNETNSKGQANENYARELFELFTLGEGNYTEKDIREAARAFTGWHILRGRYHFSSLLHDSGTKTVLGKTGPLSGEDVCRMALEQDACGRFLARKLLAFFVTPKPLPKVEQELGALMNKNGYDMTATLRVVLGSSLFFGADARRAIVKSPLEFVVGAARCLDSKLNAKAAVPALRSMGQDLLAPPNVAGWPGHREWINTATWLSRVNAGARLLRALPASARPEHLLGSALPAQEYQVLTKRATGRAALARAILALPEAHLA